MNLLSDNRKIALRLAEGLDPTPSAIDRVSQASDPESARWAFGQWELRRKAKAKFARASEMLFLREALEQSTSEEVARFHASLFPQGENVVDLTAGIGADLIALAARGPTIGFELDEERAEYAVHNLQAHALAADVRIADSLLWLESKPAIPYAFADPARRVEGRRTLRLDEFSPDPQRIAHLFSGLRLGVMKLSPMLSDDALRDLGRHIEFVSYRGECREALVFGGEAAGEGIFAVQAETGERLASGLSPTAVTEPEEFLYDCDPAAVRAHALGSLCARHCLTPLGDSNGYLTGKSHVHSTWMRPYRVLYQGKADPKSTRRALRDLGAATPELKQRGAKLDLIKERQAYAMDGKRSVSLAIWPNGKSLRHAILERITTL